MYRSTKKKIRGWKRHKRKIEVWKERHLRLDMEYVRDRHRDYAKLWIHPFYGIPNVNPPDWYNRLLVKAMIDVYDEWHRRMEAENEDFYLKIWLFEHDFIGSQIVTAYKEAIDFYSDAFDKEDGGQSFPMKRFEPLQHELNRFDWQLHIHAHYYWLSEMEEDAAAGLITREDILHIKDVSYQKVTYEHDVLYKVKAGNVWIGSLTEEPSS